MCENAYLVHSDESTITESEYMVRGGIIFQSNYLLELEGQINKTRIGFHLGCG